MNSTTYNNIGYTVTVPYEDVVRGRYSVKDLLSMLSLFPNNPIPKKVIFSGPATIVIWGDGSKTVVKCMDGDTYDKEKGFAMAYLKKMFGKYGLKKLIKEFVDDNN